MPQSTLDRDVRDLATFGYRQRLDRSLGGFSAFAAGFSYLSILTGSSQLFHLGYAAGGPAFFWTWPTVFLGQVLVALCFAELSARYPLSGGVYQWSKRVGSESAGWMAGWIYLACSVITLASVALALQATLPQLSVKFQVVGRADDPVDAARNAVLLGCGLIGLSTAVNAVGVRLLVRINNVGVFVEMLGALALIALLAACARRGPGVVFDTGGRGAGRAFGYLGPWLSSSIMASFVLYGFDTAGSLAEETDNPRRRAPRAILLALVSVGVAGSLLVFVALRAAVDLNNPALAQVGGGLPFLVKGALGSALGTPFLVVMVFSIVVCTFTVHAAGVRLLFAMARDNHLPFSRSLARVREGSRTPALPALLIGTASTALLAFNVTHPQVIEVMASVAVVWANLAYLFVTIPLALLLLQRKDRPDATHPRFDLNPDQESDTDTDMETDTDTDISPEHPRAGFSLGRWAPWVSALAVVWGLLNVVNIGWPRVEIYGTSGIGRLGAAPATLAMLAVGWVFERLVRRHRSGVLDEHRA